MTQLGTSANPGLVAVIMLPACVLAIAFMVRFFVALTVENRQPHSVHVLRPRGVNSEPDTNRIAVSYRRPAVHSAADVAIGVVRITTALASNAGRRESDSSIRRPQVVTLDRPSPEIIFLAEHRYRSG